MSNTPDQDEFSIVERLVSLETASFHPHNSLLAKEVFVNTSISLLMFACFIIFELLFQHFYQIGCIDLVEIKNRRETERRYFILHFVFVNLQVNNLQ
jgi:hypothetical protein